MPTYYSTNWSLLGPFCSRALTVFPSMALSLLKFSHWTFSQASTLPWSWNHRLRVIWFITATEESLEAMKGVGQPPSQASPQALEFPECHSFSAAKALLIKMWNSLSTRPPLQCCPAACNLLPITKELLSVHTQNAPPYLLLKCIFDSPLQL